MGKINQAEDVVIKKNKATQALVRQASSRLNLDCNNGNPEPRGNCKVHTAMFSYYYPFQGLKQNKSMCIFDRENFRVILEFYLWQFFSSSNQF